MTIPELITGIIGFVSSLALACLLGFFVGLHVAGKEQKEKLLEIIKEESEDKKQ